MQPYFDPFFLLTPLFQGDRIVKELRLAPLFSHYDGNSPLPGRRAFGTTSFKEIAIWATRPLNI